MSILSLFSNLSAKKPLTCSVVIAAAGLSQRCRGEDKLFCLLGDKPVIAHSVQAFEKCELVNEIIIVSRQERISDITAICEKYNFKKVSMVMVGGDTRLDSVMTGVYVASRKNKIIAVHDAARPCIDADIIRKSIIAARKYHAAAPAVAVSSTLKRVSNGVISETVDRSGLFEIQTPQVFKSEVIKAALSNAKKKSINVTDDCMAVELMGMPVHIVEGSRRNLKITVNEDLAIAEAFIRE